MKIRIKGNSLRYRLTKPEVSLLWSEGSLKERTEFIGKTLFYSIETVDSANIWADFINNEIVLYLPKTMAEELYKSNTVGFSDTSGPVKLLVEKDFVCIDNTEEDQTDNYPNPSLSCN